MRTVRVNVLPAAGGWELDCDLPLETTYYRSGGRAEEAARRLALRLSDGGADVKLVVHDLATQPVATQRYFAS